MLPIHDRFFHKSTGFFAGETTTDGIKNNVPVLSCEQCGQLVDKNIFRTEFPDTPVSRKNQHMLTTFTLTHFKIL